MEILSRYLQHVTHMRLNSLAVFSLGGGEIVLILALLLVFTVVMALVAGLVYVIVRAVQSRPPPVISTLPPEVVQNLRNRDLEHVKLLSIFHFIIGGFALLGVGFLGLHYFFMRTVFTNPDMWRGQRGGPPPQAIFDVMIWFYLFGGVILFCALVLNVLSGFFLWKRQHRTFSLIIAGLDCLQIPFGTALGIFTIIVLSRDSVRGLYSNVNRHPDSSRVYSA